MKISSSGFSVYLRNLERDDADSVQLNGNEYEIAYNSPSVPHPYRREDALMLIELAIQRYANREEYHFGVFLEDNTLIGVCALANIDLINKKAELGYWLGKKYWGHGYAKQAIRLILSFGFNNLELNRIYAKVLTYNERSIGLLNSMQFQKESLNREDAFHMGKFLDDFTFVMLKKEYSENDKITLTD